MSVNEYAPSQNMVANRLDLMARLCVFQPIKIKIVIHSFIVRTLGTK